MTGSINSKNRTYKIPEEDDLALKEFKKSSRYDLNEILHLLNKNVLRAHQDVKKSMIDYISSELAFIRKKMIGSGELELNDLRIQEQNLLELGLLFNDGKELMLENNIVDPSMTKIRLYNGYLLYPMSDDWVLVNADEAAGHTQAIIVETHDSPNAARHIPHFIYFHSNGKEILYDQHFLDIIDDKCIKLYPEFRVALDESNLQLIHDPENPRKILNEREYLNAPRVGHYPVYVHGDPDFGKKYEPPFGVMIIRD